MVWNDSNFVPEGSHVTNHLYTIHRNLCYFSPFPDSFLPERWMPEKDQQLIPDGSMSPGIDSGRIGASADERIADKSMRMDLSKPPFSEWLFDPWGPSLLPRASSLYNSFPLHTVLLSLLSYMSYLT